MLFSRAIPYFGLLRPAAAAGALTVGVLWGVTACGGSGANRDANDASSEKSAGTRRSSETSEADASDGEEPSSSEETPRGPCDDGSCFTCGTGYCPTGWYCDESARGGAACAWLPNCDGKNACSCLEQKLGASCSCSENDGGPRVTCK